MDGIPEDKLLDLFIGTLKDNIKHELLLFELDSLKNDFMLAKKVESKNLVMDTTRTTSNTSRENNVLYSNLHKPTRLTP